ncbi:hypothetical protein VNO77_44645 [Canavalia gladiata]|uniref:Uncharacterized protein n=1 Tax=Canavalia gladiata TaxID=3824 RepID=A0AAN9JYU6_CANGL
MAHPIYDNYTHIFVPFSMNLDSLQSDTKQNKIGEQTHVPIRNGSANLSLLPQEDFLPSPRIREENNPLLKKKKSSPSSSPFFFLSLVSRNSLTFLKNAQVKKTLFGIPPELSLDLREPNLRNKLPLVNSVSFCFCTSSPQRNPRLSSSCC